MAFRYTPTPTPSVSPTLSLTPSNTPSFTPTGTICPDLTPTMTPSNTATQTTTPTNTPTQMTPTPTQTTTPTPTVESGVLYVYAKYRDTANTLQYQINYGSPVVISYIDTITCEYAYTITGLLLGDNVYFTTYGGCVLALDTPPAECPDSGFACDQTYIWTGNDYVYITVDGSICC